MVLPCDKITYDDHEAALPAWINEDLIATTLRTWMPRYGAEFGRADAIDMIRRVGRLYDIFDEIDRYEEIPGSSTGEFTRTGA